MIKDKNDNNNSTMNMTGFSHDSRSTNLSSLLLNNNSTLELTDLTLEMVKEMKEDFEDNPILTQAYPKEKYSKQTYCHYCEKKKKNSVFVVNQLVNW